MLTSDQIEALRDRAGQITDPIVEYLLEDIAQRVSEAGQFTSTASYEAWRLQNLGLSQRDIQAAIQERLKVSQEQAKELLTQAAEVGYRFDMDRFPTLEAIPFEENTSLQQIVSAITQQADEDLTSITQTMGFVGTDGRVRELTEAYQQACDFAFEKVVTGAQDYNSAIRDALRGLSKEGIQTIDYASGRHRSVEAAVRANIMGGLGLMEKQISQKNHDDLGCDGWEISAHAASAPDHEPIQGKQYSDAEYKAINDSLARGIGEFNCGHSAFPIILGVNSPQYTPQELEQFRQENERGVWIDGQHYTTYEATQRQRRFEREIRFQKHRVLICKASGDDEKLQNDQIRLVRLQQEYKRFSKKAGLPEQWERAEAAGFTWKEGREAEKATKKYNNEQNNFAKLPPKPVDKPGKDDTILKGKVSQADLNAREDIQRALAGMLKIDVSAVDLSELPTEAHRYVLDATSKVYTKYPQLVGHTTKISFDPNLTATASSKSITGTVKIGPAFQDLEKLQRDHNYGIKLKYHPKGTEDLSSILVHEYGHQLDGWLTKQGAYGGSISQYGVVRTSEAVQKEVLNRLGLSGERLREIRSEWYARGYRGEDLTYAVRWERQEFIAKHVSEYATKNCNEFFAECFSEYMMSDNPREAARIFGEILEEIMEGFR